jgi:hypothetical protein
MIRLTTVRRFCICAVVAVFILFVFGGMRATSQRNASQSTSAQPGLGFVTADKYTNDSVGITYIIPKGWFVDTAAMVAANDSTKKYVATHDDGGQFKNYQGSVWLMVSKLSEKPNTRPGSSISLPSITLSGSRVGPTDLHKTPFEIQKAAKQQLEAKDRVVYVTGPTDFSVGGQTFSRIDKTLGAFIYWSDAVTVRNHVRIDFQFMADSATQLEDMYKSLNTLEFRNPD